MFSQLEPVATDSILGLMSAFQADQNPNKVDLGVGVYKDEASQTPILQSVKQAEALRNQQETTKSYIGMAGDLGFNSHLERMAFGENSSALQAGRITTAHTPGGTGALRVAAELLKRAKPDARIWVSKPTWANHLALFKAAGLAIQEYSYYDYEHKNLQAEAMFAELAQVPAGDIVLMHACCHNPSGMDLDQAQWERFTELALERGFIPMIDMAYQGFGVGLEQDAWGLRHLAERVDELVLCTSCSKNFGLYRERIGAVSLMTADAKTTEIGRANLLTVVRGIYSMPPSHGAIIVKHILDSPELTQLWHEELAEMRDRINHYRQYFVDKLAEAGIKQSFAFITQQHGMFSFMGLNKAQVHQLIEDFSIYMVDSSRINIAGLNQNNIDYVASSIAKVLKNS